jgi:hypothetical protein
LTAFQRTPTIDAVLARVLSAALVGVEAALVRVEVDVTSGLPAFTIVGRDYRISRTHYAPFDFLRQRVWNKFHTPEYRGLGAA